MPPLVDREETDPEPTRERPEVESDTDEYDAWAGIRPKTQSVHIKTVFQEALGLRTVFPECHLAFARALETVGRVREALHHYRTYVNDPSAVEQRAEVTQHIVELSRLGFGGDTGTHRRVATGQHPVITDTDNAW